jgi:hypothetical protein
MAAHVALDAKGVRPGGGLIQFRHQGTDAALQPGSIRRLGGYALQEFLLEPSGATAIPAADGDFELRDEFGKCHGDDGS